MKKISPKSELVTAFKEAGEVFRLCSRKTKILAALAWGSDVADDFFRKKEGALPAPQYAIDRKMVEEVIEALEAVGPKLQGEHPVLHWLTRMQKSFLSGCQLLLEIEKPTFYEISTEIYGNSQSKPFNGQSSNMDLAQAISSRISVCNLNDIGESRVEKSADEFAVALEERLKLRLPHMPVRVEVTDHMVAKVVAGMNRVRIRKDARFSELELHALWNHEIESHCLTAHNGSLQEHCDFLAGGGPRSTMTQEGLAVFYEVYGHTMSQQRFLTLCNRIEATSMVEKGADFIEVYRWYCERSESAIEAFYQAQRVFRGAPLGGGAPFTKDVVYIGGLIGVYNFLRIAVKNQNRVLVESLVCGRMSLEDVGTIAWLRVHGLISPPRYIPDWLKNWEALLSFFSLSAVLGTMDLMSFQGYFDDHYTLESWDLSL